MRDGLQIWWHVQYMYQSLKYTGFLQLCVCWGGLGVSSWCQVLPARFKQREFFPCFVVIGSLRLDFNLSELYTQQAAESPGIHCSAIISYQTPGSWTLHCEKQRTPQRSTNKLLSVEIKLCTGSFKFIGTDICYWLAFNQKVVKDQLPF